MRPTQDELRRSYDRVAGEYARQFSDELEKKPFDRKMLEWLAESLVAAGFALEEVVERDPYPEVEYQSRRAYIFARKP